MKNIKMRNIKMTIIAAVILILAAVTSLTFAAGINNVKEVEAETLKLSNLSQSITVSGNVEAKDVEEIILSTEQKVKKIYAVEGQEVKKNDIILTVDTADLEYQLSKYRLNLDVASRSLERLQKKFFKVIKSLSKMQ